MKLLLLLIVFGLLAGLNSFGQIIDTKNSWNYLEVRMPLCKKIPNCEGKFYQNYNYFFGNDTIINDKTYAILYESTRRASDTIAYPYITGFLRDEENHKKVYYLPDQKDETEILLYDFTLQTNSVFKSKYFDDKVGNIDSVLVNGIKRLRIQFNHQYNNWIEDLPSQELSYEWIEGIGSLQGLITFYYGSEFSLLCFKQNNEIILDNDYHFDCSYAAPLNSIYTEKNEEISIYPNPASDLLTVQSKKIIHNLSIYSVTGEKIYQVHPQNAFYQINLTNFTRGFYLVRIDNNFKKIIIE